MQFSLRDLQFTEKVSSISLTLAYLALFITVEDFEIKYIWQFLIFSKSYYLLRKKNVKTTDSTENKWIVFAGSCSEKCLKNNRVTVFEFSLILAF